MNTPTNIIVHHSFSPEDQTTLKSEASFEKTHKGKGYPRSALGWHIGYHWVVYSDGEIRQYRRDDEIGIHCKEQGMNAKSIGICLEGNFDTEDPNREQIESLEHLMRGIVRTHNISIADVYPHRRFATYKSCYGSRLPDNWARNLIINETPMIKLIRDNRTTPATILPALPAATPEELRIICKSYGRILPTNPDGTVDFTQLVYDGEIK